MDDYITTVRGFVNQTNGNRNPKHELSDPRIINKSRAVAGKPREAVRVNFNM